MGILNNMIMAINTDREEFNLDIDSDLSFEAYIEIIIRSIEENEENQGLSKVQYKVFDYLVYYRDRLNTL